MQECRSTATRAFLLTLLISSLALCLAGCGHRAATYIAKGDELLARRKYHDALMQYRSAAELDDSSAKAHWGLARTYEALGDMSGVVDELRKTVELDDSNIDAKAKLGSYHLLAKPPMISEAEAMRDQIFSRDPRSVQGELLTASIMAAENKPDTEVVAQVEKAIAIDPKRVDSYVSLERLYMTRDKAVEAEAAIKRAIQADPSAIDAYTEYGRFLMYAGRDIEAEAQFQKAVSLDGNNIDAREALAEFYMTTRQMQKAEQAYIQLVQIQENSPESRLELASFYEKATRKDEAIGTLEQILRDTPSYVLARYKLAEIYLDHRQSGKVAEQLDALLKINDDDTTALMLRGRLNLQENKPEDAVKDVEEVLKKYPSDRDGLFVMAQARLAMGQIDHANAFIADLDRYHPEYLKTGLLKVQAAFSGGDLQSALRLSNELFNRANSAQPGADQDAEALQEVRIRAVTSRGLAYLEMGNLAAAKTDLENVTRSSPGSSAAMVNLARVLVAEKNNAGALDLYEKALAVDNQSFDAMSGVVATSIRLQQQAKAHERVGSMLNANSSDTAMQAAIHYLNSTVYESEKNLQAAEGELRAALDLDGTYFAAYTAYAALLARENRIDEAVAQYKAVLDKRPSAQVSTLLGILEEGRGDVAAAEAAYRNALQTAPDTAIAANNLAWIISENGGNLDEALQLATMAVQKDPRSPGYYDTLGWVYLKKGLSSPAVEQMKKAVAMDEISAKINGTPPNASYRVRLGMALAKYGDKASAKREVETGLKNVSMLSQREQTDARNVLASL